jgi:hypothetical protein
LRVCGRKAGERPPVQQEISQKTASLRGFREAWKRGGNEPGSGDLLVAGRQRLDAKSGDLQGRRALTAPDPPKLRTSGGNVTRDRRFELLLSEDEFVAWQAQAEREGRSLAAFVRGCVQGWLEIVAAQDRNEAQLRRQAERLHGMDPVRAREFDFGRSWRPDEDGPSIEGGSRS